MTTLRFKSSLIAGACFLLAGQAASVSIAGDNKAHSLAERFAGAHEPNATGSKPATSELKAASDANTAGATPLTTEDVEKAFEQRKQAEALKRHDELISSIEDRTRAIERLLEKTEEQSWHSEVTANPATAPLTNRNAQAVSKSPSDTTETAQQAAQMASEDAPDGGRTETLNAADLGKPMTSNVSDTATPRPLAPPLAAVIDEILPEQDPAPTSGTVAREIDPPTYALGAPRDLGQGLAQAAVDSSRATVLLIMEPGNKGIRRFKKTADPVLCSRFHCYRSQGPGRSAVRLARGATLGPFNTLGLRAGSCRSQLTCTFRDVELGTNATAIQPVDLKLIKHDRRQQRAVTVDSTCQIHAGRIHCTKPIVAKTWKAWIVPEALAIEAGADALQAALDEGLSERPPETIVSQPLAPDAFD
jgi:hypothetical protein